MSEREWTYQTALEAQKANGLVRGAMIRLGREARGMSLRAFSKKSGVSVCRLKHLEAGNHKLPRAEVLDLAEAMDRPPGFLYWQDRIEDSAPLFVERKEKP